MADGQVGFVGKDVAEVLGYSNTRDAIRKHVDAEDKTTVAICDTGSNYKTQAAVINESGLYSLILSSKLPKAREFKHWVTSEVLPQIRKTGGYIPVREEDDEKTILCKALLIYKRTIEEKEALLSSGRKAIGVPSATMFKDSYMDFLAPLRLMQTPLHVAPDRDRAGEALYEKLLEAANSLGLCLCRHNLPEGCKDFSDYWRTRAIDCPEEGVTRNP